jgi:hypothetical protein
LNELVVDLPLNVTDSIKEKWQAFELKMPIFTATFRSMWVLNDIGQLDWFAPKNSSDHGHGHID